MIPILYDTAETDFLSNGIGRLTECISCEVTEERNGIYECEFRYPLSGRFCKTMMESGGVVSVTHDNNGDRQAFDIYKFSAPIDGVVTFNAHHISYRLNGVIVTPFSASSCAGALQGIKDNSANANPFSFYTDKAVNASYSLSVPANARAMLAGQSGSILDVFGTGEYEFDMFNVNLHLHRGQDNGVTIRYGKNLSEITNTVDKSGTYNAIAPFWTNGNTTVTLPEVYIAVSGATDIYCVPADFTADFETQPSKSDLRAAAVAKLATLSPTLPDENITINFEALWQTADYEDVAVLQKVSLCDTVSIFFSALGVTRASAKIIKTVYDSLNEKYISMEFGKALTTLSESILGQYGNSLSDLSGGKILGASFISVASLQVSSFSQFLDNLIVGADWDTGYPTGVYFADPGGNVDGGSFVDRRGFQFDSGEYRFTGPNGLYPWTVNDPRIVVGGHRLNGDDKYIGIQFTPFMPLTYYHFEFTIHGTTIIDESSFAQKEDDYYEYGFEEAYGVFTVARVTPNTGKTDTVQKNKTVITSKNEAEIDLYGPGESASILSMIVPRSWKQYHSGSVVAVEVGNNGTKSYIILRDSGGNVRIKIDTSDGCTFARPVSCSSGVSISGGVTADSVSVSGAASLHNTTIDGNVTITGDLKIGNTTLNESQLQQLLALI